MIVDWIALGFGWLLLILVLRHLVQYGFFLRRSRITHGIVVDSQQRMSAGGRYRPTSVTHPVIEFATLDNQPVHAESSIGSYPQHTHLGERVKIRYDTRNPKKIIVIGKEWLRFVVVIPALAAGCFAPYITIAVLS